MLILNTNNTLVKPIILFKIIVGLVLLCCNSIFSQENGDFIEKVELQSFNELINYIHKTESKPIDSIDLDRRRFEYFDKVNVYGITYWSDSLKVKGFLLKPKASGKYPAIIYNRGGSLEFGSLTHGKASIGLGELAKIAFQGYVVAASQYRGNGGSEGQEEYGGSDINDVLNLIPLLQSQTSVNINKLGMFGWSRGAMTSLLTIKKTNKIKAVVLGGPSTNLVRGIIDRPLLDEWWSKFIPNYNINKEEVLKKRSAIYWVNELPKNVPILLLQGENDKALPVDYTLDFAKEFSKHKVPYKLIKFEDGNHALKKYKNEVFEQLFLWFERHL